MASIASTGAPRHRGVIPGATIMMLLPVLAGSLAMLINSWGGFIEAAFMDMTLTLESFDYRFGPSECGGRWFECGNGTFDAYVRARDLSIALFFVGLVAVAVKDMLKGAFGGDFGMGAADNKSLPQMLQYSILVFAFLFAFPPMWDAMAGTMNNVGVWILNPHYDVGRHGGYEHGRSGGMCVGDITYGDLVRLAPYVRNGDAWIVYGSGTGPLGDDGRPTTYGTAANYVIPPGGAISQSCLNAGDACPAAMNRPGLAPPPGDILCDPAYKVRYVFQQALGVTEVEAVNPEQLLGSVFGVGGDDILTGLITQFLKSSVTLQIVMVVFMTGVMVDVVTAFALAILPVVFFYRFLPMSNRVQLGDYSGAAFALLAMPLVASVVLVAGAGTVSVMAASDQNFDSFFTWLAALSVVLLVIGIPATMVPLIGAAQAQATAAIQTGVQTAQFAGMAAASAAGGAIRGGRAGAELGRLQGMKPDEMSQEQRVRMEQLKQAGHASTARSALQGGWGGMRGQMYDEKTGQPTKEFRNVVAPGTGPVTATSLKGLAGFDAGDAVKDMRGIQDSVGEAAAGVAGTAASQRTRPPTSEETAAEAKRRRDAATKDLEESGGRLDRIRREARTVEGYDDAAKRALELERAAAGEEGRLSQARKATVKAEWKMKEASAELERARKEGAGKDVVKKHEAAIKQAEETITQHGKEVTRATEAMTSHTQAVRDEVERLAGLVGSGVIAGQVAEVIQRRYNEQGRYVEAEKRHKQADDDYAGLRRELDAKEEAALPKYPLPPQPPPQPPGSDGEPDGGGGEPDGKPGGKKPGGKKPDESSPPWSWVGSVPPWEQDASDDKPGGGKPDDKPDDSGGGKPDGGKPDDSGGGKPGGGKPDGGKPDGGKPDGGKPDDSGGGKPDGGKPDGGKPDGKPGGKPGGGKPDDKPGDKPGGGKPDDKPGDKPGGGKPGAVSGVSMPRA